MNRLSDDSGFAGGLCCMMTCCAPALLPAGGGERARFGAPRGVKHRSDRLNKNGEFFRCSITYPGVYYVTLKFLFQVQNQARTPPPRPRLCVWGEIYSTDIDIISLLCSLFPVSLSWTLFSGPSTGYAACYGKLTTGTWYILYAAGYGKLTPGIYCERKV